jgi:hypothetical protein
VWRAINNGYDGVGMARSPLHTGGVAVVTAMTQDCQLMVHCTCTSARHKLKAQSDACSVLRIEEIV